jgi:hypothetical protein
MEASGWPLLSSRGEITQMRWCGPVQGRGSCQCSHPLLPLLLPHPHLHTHYTLSHTAGQRPTTAAHSLSQQPRRRNAPVVPPSPQQSVTAPPSPHLVHQHSQAAWQTGRTWRRASSTAPTRRFAQCVSSLLLLVLRARVLCVRACVRACAVRAFGVRVRSAQACHEQRSAPWLTAAEMREAARVGLVRGQPALRRAPTRPADAAASPRPCCCHAPLLHQLPGPSWAAVEAAPQLQRTLTPCTRTHTRTRTCPNPTPPPHHHHHTQPPTSHTQNLIEKITRNKIYSSVYWKKDCFGLSAEALVDKAVELKYIGE